MRALLLPLLIMCLLLITAFVIRRESRFVSWLLIGLAVTLGVVLVLGFTGLIGRN